MAQRARGIAAVLERWLRCHHGVIPSGAVAQPWFFADRYLVCQRLADRRPLAVPGWRGQIHTNSLVARLVSDCRRLAGDAAGSQRTLVVQADVRHPVAADCRSDPARQLPAAPPWRVPERGRGAIALCTAAAWPVLSRQGRRARGA